MHTPRMADFLGTWLTRDGRCKLVIGEERVTSYCRGETGEYEKVAASCAMLDSGCTLRKAGGGYDLAGYAYIEKEGALLYAAVPVCDTVVTHIFAREGHPEDFI